MNLVLHPRFTQSGSLRLWLGVFGQTTSPTVQWLLDGKPRQPKVVNSLKSVRDQSLLRGNSERTFSGVYEFTGLRPNTSYTVEARTDGGTASISARTLPAEIPRETDRWMNVLLVSCFHYDEDREGVAGQAVETLRGDYQPHLTLLMGDQVYLDLPTLQNFPSDEFWLAEKFENDYIRNRRGPTGYAKILAAAASVSIPDDHEYWNNFPHRSPFIENSYAAEGRARWKKAAQALYNGFQLDDIKNVGVPIQFDVPPLSFFLADTRTLRDENLAYVLPQTSLRKLDRWINHVVKKNFYGVFVSGQSYFSPAVDPKKGEWADYELANYRDYATVVRKLVALARPGRPLLCLTGDVHWGRVAKAEDRTTHRRTIYEIISSPSSLVTTAFQDPWRNLNSFVKGLFGSRNPWPRHDDAPLASDFFAQQVLGSEFECTTLHRQKGNHVVLLSFRQAGFGLDCRVRYLPIHKDSSVAAQYEKEFLLPRLV